MNSPADRMVWIDLETTGLDPLECTILEMACVITNAAGGELAHVEGVVHLASPRGPVWDQAAFRMHLENGLLRDCANAVSDASLHVLALRVCNLIEDFGAEGSPLCGSSVHYDRAVLTNWRASSDSILDMLHYRNVDVSGLREIARLVGWPTPPAPDPKPHRALADVRASIALYRYYLERLRFVHILVPDQ